MENLIFAILIIVFVVLVIIFNKDDGEPFDEMEDNWKYPDEDNYISGYDPYEKDKEEMFYHPTTGYKGTRAEMDAYIINRENEMKDEKI